MKHDVPAADVPAAAPPDGFAVLDAVAAGITVQDASGRLVYANAAAARLIGLPSAEAMLQAGPADIVARFEILDAEGRPLPAAELPGRRALEEKVPVARLLRFRLRPEGEERWAWVAARPLAIAGGPPAHVLNTFVDAAELVRTRAQAEYEALRGEVAALMGGPGDVRDVLHQCCEALIKRLPLSFAGVWLFDPSGQWLDVEASAGNFGAAGRTAQGRLVAGTSSLGRIAAERRPHVTNTLLADPPMVTPPDDQWARAAGMTAFAGYPLVVLDRAIGVLGAFAERPLPDDTVSALERTVDTIAYGIDRRRAEAALDQRARELARSNADLEQFAYVASHDLQEPLRIVASYNQLLARRYQGKLDSDADEFIAFSIEGISRMQRLISDLLAYSRVGSRARGRAPVEMERMLAMATDNLAHAITDAGARVTRGPLPVVTGDEGLLLQLLQNLISNGVKFHGPAAPVVHVSARAGDREWTFAVSDNGVGIEAQYFDRIFVIFQRLHARESYPGTGIGLALCKRIVERHGGRIWLDSIPGKGSTFFFTLPAD